jgi:hypothetical protein
MTFASTPSVSLYGELMVYVQFIFLAVVMLDAVAALLRSS